MNTSQQIAGRAALTTGASSGIGADTATCSPRTAPPVAPFGRRKDELDTVAAEITAAGGARTVRRLAVELLGELRQLDRRGTDATATLSAAVAASGTTFTELRGIGDVMAVRSSPAPGPSAGSAPSPRRSGAWN